VDGGTTVEPSAVAQVNGVRVSVSRLIAASNIVRVELKLDGKLPAAGWIAVGEVRHRDRVMRFVTAEPESDGAIALMTDGGVDDASGEWTVTVDELAGGDDRLAGPWVLRFNAP
jgi:hypothetical protein